MRKDSYLVQGSKIGNTKVIIAHRVLNRTLKKRHSERNPVELWRGVLVKEVNTTIEVVMIQGLNYRS